jgi:hypothetical protein
MGTGQALGRQSRTTWRIPPIRVRALQLGQVIGLEDVGRPAAMVRLEVHYAAMSPRHDFAHAAAGDDSAPFGFWFELVADPEGTGSGNQSGICGELINKTAGKNLPRPSRNVVSVRPRPV